MFSQALRRATDSRQDIPVLSTGAVFTGLLHGEIFNIISLDHLNSHCSLYNNHLQLIALILFSSGIYFAEGDTDGA